jgi:hypothetical protein
MLKNNGHKQKDALRDFIDTQEHQLDPGYWTHEVYGKGRSLPLERNLKGLHLSSFSRSLMIFVLLSPLLIGLFARFADGLQHPWFWCAITLLVVFLCLWGFMHWLIARNG